MKLRALAVLLLPLAVTFSAHASSGAQASPTPTLLGRTLQMLHLTHPPKPKSPPLIHHQLELKLDIAPTPISLSSDREVQATVSLYNRSKKYVDLNFPTTQRIEILILDPSGKVVTTWSEDQSFTDDPASVTVNPGERLQYNATVATREMTAGLPYVIQASFPNYPDLKVEQTVIPQK